MLTQSTDCETWGSLDQRYQYLDVVVEGEVHQADHSESPKMLKGDAVAAEACQRTQNHVGEAGQAHHEEGDQAHHEEADQE